MLCLSRSKDDRIYLPDVGVEIRVLDVQRGKVSLGISAPKHIAVYRDDCPEWLATQGQYPQLATDAR